MSRARNLADDSTAIAALASDATVIGALSDIQSVLTEFGAAR